MINPRYADLEARIKSRPTISVPTVHLHGQADGCVLASSLTDQSASFSAGYRRAILPSIGHFVPRERPEAVVAAIANA